MPEKPWTRLRILKRVVVGSLFLAVTITGFASILYFTTDPLSDRREQRVAATQTWALIDPDTQSSARVLQGRAPLDPELLVVREAPATQPSERGMAGVAAAVREARSQARNNDTLVLVWADGSFSELLDGTGTIGIEQVRRYLSELLTAGADGIVLDVHQEGTVTRASFPRAAVSAATHGAAEFAELISAMRSVEPSLIVLAHAPAPEALTPEFTNHVDGLLRIAQTPPAVEASIHGSPVKQVIYRDWFAGKPVLVLTKEGSGSDQFARSLDFLPRTRLP